MDYRDNRILNILLKNKNTSILQLADEFQISERMVKKQIKNLNDDLMNRGISAIHIDTDGNVAFQDSSDELDMQVKAYIIENDYYTYRLTLNERRTIIAMIILNSDGYVTAAALADYLCISRNTMLSDMEELKKWFADNGMVLFSKVQKGYVVQGGEQDIRNGILKLIRLNYGYMEYQNEVTETFQHLILKELKYEQWLPQIRNIVKEAEIQQSLHFSDFSFAEVINELLILLNRISIGKVLPENSSDDELVNSSKYPLSRLIMDRMEEVFHVQIPSVEKKHYVKALRRKSYIQSSSNNVDELAVPVIIGNVIYQICCHFDICFYLDFALYDVLVDHIKSIIHRSRVGEFLPNPFGNEMEERYPEIFEVVSSCVKPLENYIGMPLKKDEISFLVMYFVSMIEREKQERMVKQKVAVALVGGMGRGTMNLFRAEIGKLDDIIEVKQVCSVHNIQDLDEKMIDMVISYVPVFPISEHIRVVNIPSLLLSRDDLYQIRMTATEIQEIKQKESSLTMETSIFDQVFFKAQEQSYIIPERIQLDFFASDWREAVRKAGNLLEESGAVTREYVDAMVENVVTNGTYIVILPGFAIPHAEPKYGAKYEAVSLVRLKEPVKFGHEKNDPVVYVVGMSILNANTINRLMYNLVNIFNDTKYRKKLDMAQNAEEVYTFIKDML